MPVGTIFVKIRKFVTAKVKYSLLELFLIIIYTNISSYNGITIAVNKNKNKKLVLDSSKRQKFFVSTSLCFLY